MNQLCDYIHISLVGGKILSGKISQFIPLWQPSFLTKACGWVARTQRLPAPLSASVAMKATEQAGGCGHTQGPQDDALKLL